VALSLAVKKVMAEKKLTKAAAGGLGGR